MIGWLALTVWIAVSAGVYLALSRDVFRCVLGLAILGSAANMVLLAAGRLGPSAPAVVPLGQTSLTDAANPLPQALVLTAIVIGFALVCFSLALALRMIQRIGTDDALALRQAEPLPIEPVKPPVTPVAFEPAWPETPIAQSGGGR
jgi:multicomponent Na+:H+ antiporter subunit C